MKIGPKRQLFTLQTVTETSSLDGQPVPEWSDVGTYRGSLRTPTGRELFNAAQIKAVLSHVVEMRYIGPIAPNQRFKFGERVFDITYVNNVDGRNREYHIYVTEVVSPS